MHRGTLLSCANCATHRTPETHVFNNSADCTVQVTCSNDHCTVKNTPNASHSFTITDCTVAVQCANCVKMSTPESEHNYDENGVCQNTNCGYGCAHTDTTTTTNDSTCCATGLTTVTCNECGKITTTVIEKKDHTLTAVGAKSATCTEAGWNAYSTCSAACCSGKFFTDVDGVATETAWSAIEIPAAGHAYSALNPQVDAGCETTGKKAYHTCANCSKIFDESKVETTEAALILPARSVTLRRSSPPLMQPVPRRA